jgi:putative two-component system response regulator
MATNPEIYHTVSVQNRAALLTPSKGDLSVSYTDNLTGLYNHSFFQISLDLELKRFKRYGAPFVLALVDIDWFSYFNENNTHIVGDLMLKEVAQKISANIRDVDIAARYGGDQFFIMIPETELDEALIVAQRIRQSVEKIETAKITISIGLVACPMDAIDRLGLIQKTYEALHEAKIRGKNKVFRFEPQKQVDDSTNYVLIVDDTPVNLKMLEALLVSENYKVIKALGGKEALHTIIKYEKNIDLILLDIMMPGMNGYEVCKHLKQNNHTRLIPIIAVTALSDIEARVKCIEAGADDFITRPLNKIEFLTRIKHLIDFRKTIKKLTDIKDVLLSLVNIVEAKDIYTQGHVERVANLAVLIGNKLNLSSKEIESLWFAGILHDIGKISIPTEILNKPGPLSPEEFDLMASHSIIGYKICLPLESTLGYALHAIRHHHERLDGSGYPDQLKGDSIPIITRIMSVVDMFDAMTTDRPYRKAIPLNKAFEILQQDVSKGKLDAMIVEKLYNIVIK